MKTRIYLAILIVVSSVNGLIAMKSEVQSQQPNTKQQTTHTFKFKCVDSTSDEDVIEMPGDLVHYSKTLTAMADSISKPTDIIPLFTMTKEELQRIIHALKILTNPQKTYPDLVAYFASLNQGQLLKSLLHIHHLAIQPLLKPAAQVLQKYLVESSTDILTWQSGLPADILTLLKNITVSSLTTPLVMCNLSVKTLPESFSSTALNEDGTLFAVAKEDNSIELINSAEAQQKTTLQGHAELVNALQFSPDGNNIASASQEDNTIRLWDIATHQEIAHYKNHLQSRNANMQFSSDNNYFACVGWDNPNDDTSHETYALINRKTGQKHMFSGVKGMVYDIAISPDGKQAALVGDEVYLWNTQTQKLTVLPIGSAIKKPVTKAAFSPNSTLLACSGSETELGTTEIMMYNLTDITAKEPVLKIITKTIPTIIAFSQDSTLMAFDDEETVVVWNIQTDQPITRVDSHVKLVHSLAFTPDNNYLISTSHDNKLRILDIPNEQEKQFSADSSIIDSAYALDNTTVVSLSEDGTLHTWDIGTGQSKKLAQVPNATGIAVINPDNTLLALSSQGGTIHLLNTQTGQTRIFSQGAHPLVDLEFSFDGQFLLAVYANGTTLLWDVKTGISQKIAGAQDKSINKAHYIGDGTFILVEEKAKNFINLYDIQKNVTSKLTHDTDIQHIAFSTDGKQLIASAQDNAIIIWDVDTQRIAKQLKSFGTRFAVSPNGHTLAVHDEKHVYLVDVQNGIQHILATNHNFEDDDMFHMMFNTDGSLLVIHNGNNKDAQNAIQLWDTATYTLKQTITVSINAIINFFFVPNTAIIGIVAKENVLLCNADTNQLLVTYDLRCWHNAVSMSTDGSKIILSGTTKNNESETVILTLDQTLAKALHGLSFTQAFIVARALQNIAKGTMLDLSNSPLLAIFNQIDRELRSILERCLQIKTK